MSVSFFGLIVVLLLAFVAVKALFWIFSHANEARGWVAILALLIVGIGLYGMLGVRHHRVITGEEIAVNSAPIPPGYNLYPPAPPVALIAPDAGQLPQPSIEELWKHLTAPHINLEETTEATSDAAPIDPSSSRELTDAAKMILSASLPGADPFTQGWLINAAKSIVSATPKAEASAIRSEGVEASGQARPDWVSAPPNPAGDLRRVVSTDPLNTMEECRAQLEARLRFAVADRVRALAKQTGQSAANGPMLADMGVSPDFILRELCPEGAYVETVNSSAGEMKRAHALVEFTPLKDEVLLHRWQTAMRAPGSVSADAALATTEALPRTQSYTTGERPDWVVHPPKQVGNVRRFVVVSDPFSTADEARKQVNHKMQELVLQRGRELASPLPGPGSLGELGIGGDFVRREHCTDEFVDVIETSVGEMARVYVLLEFNETQDDFLVDCMRRHARRGGLITTMLIAASVLGCVATLFGLLKADTWTRGYYTKRLFLGVPAAIITVLALLTVA